MQPCDYLPHSGDMCLIDGIVNYDTQSITCQTESHQLTSNPLRNNKQLASINGIEYAAQAAALHLALAKITTQHRGMLASIQECQLYVQRLDIIKTPISIVSELLFCDQDHSAFYQFRLSSEKTELVTGRLLIVLETSS